MTKDTLIKDIMSTKLISLHPKDKLKRAKEIFQQYDIHHIPVHVMGSVKGIISLGDILFLEGIVTNSFDEFLRTKKYDLATVDEIMTPKPICISSEKHLNDALDIMITRRINALPVTENNILVGLITTYDILRLLKTQINE